MKHIWLTVGLICLVLTAFGQVFAAGLEIRATSPQAVDGAISMADADSFHVDIWMKNNELDDQCGGSFAVALYSPDGSIQEIKHLPVWNATHTMMVGKGSTRSIEYLNDVKDLIYEVLIFTTENGWGEDKSTMPAYSIGTLPDSVKFDLAGTECLKEWYPDLNYFRFNLRVDNPGLLCIDSVQYQFTEDNDWLWPAPWKDNTTFSGPYCWTIGDYEPDFPPVITCPDDAVVGCGESTDPANTGTATAIDDNDPSPDIAYTDVTSAGTCPDITIITRTWTATDDKAQTSTCDQIITVRDLSAPEINCPSNTTVECIADIDPANTGTATATDDCDATPTVTYADGAITDGVFVRTWTAVDDCGNSSQCEQTITIDDNTPPTVTCPDDIMVNSPAGTCSANVEFELSATDNCGGVTVTSNPMSGTTFGLGTTVVTVTATDDAGNTNTCTFNVTVNDNEAPTITFCPEDITLECGASSHPDNTGYATASDLCDGSVDITWNDSDPVEGVITRTWTATDNFGNTATCDQSITLAEDSEAPVFTSECPADVTVECDAIPDPPEMTATDNCGGVTINFTESVTPGACEDTYVLTRTWVATDNSGNTAQCIQTVTVRDTTNPVITSCPDDVTLTCGASSHPDNTGYATATDNCDAEPTITYADGDIVEGVFTRSWTVEDNCGNSVTCDQVITIVEDDEAPVFSMACPEDATVECDAVPEAPVMTASDNCDGDVTVTFNENITPGSCEFSYTIDRSWSATDTYGNTAECTQTIIVQDTQAPELACPDDITVGYGQPTDPEHTGFATATDNCDGEPVVTYEDGPTVDRVFTRTWTAADVCGNSSECPQVITMEDMGDPFLIANPESFAFNVTEYDILESELLNISERYNRQVSIGASNNEPWLIITSSFPLTTPNVIFFNIDASELTMGIYKDTIYVTSAEAQNSPLKVPVEVDVEPFIPPPDSVWVSTVPAVPGGKAVVPVYFKNNDPLTQVNVPMEWSMDGLYLDSVSFVGSRVAYISGFEKGYSFNNTSRQVQITINPTFSDDIPGGRGLLAKMYFTVSEFMSTPSFVAINSTFIPPDGYVYFEDYMGEEDIPVYTPGGVVVDDQTAFVCGSVVEVINGVKVPVVGATVEFWDNFPAGALMTAEMTDGNGQFACGTLGIVPFDAYAYKDGYYPGMVSDIDFGTLGIEIKLTRVSDVHYSDSWVLFFSGESGGCQSYFMNIPLPAGSVVDAFIDEEPPIHCGTFFVTTPGTYSMSVYGDDPQTAAKDGAWEGDELTFFINGYPAETDAPVYWHADDLSVELCFDLLRIDTRVIELAAGRNLISWNIDTPSDAIEDIFADVMDDVEAILGFEQGGFTYDPMYPEFSNLLFADHLHGYWVEMLNPATLVLTGAPVSPATPIDLESEWNLVSYLPNEALEPPDALASIWDYLDLVLGWDADGAKDYEPAHPEYAQLEWMEPGYGYWLYMSAAATLTYPGAGPGTVFSQGPAKLNIAKARDNIATSRLWTNIFSTNLTLDGDPVLEGTEIIARSADNRSVGSGVMGANGKFGFIPVYGDDPMTEKVEGLAEGETFNLVIDGVETEERFVWNSDNLRIEIGAVNSARSNTGLLPDQYGLAQNYPNPFNPTTTLSFSVPAATNVTLEIFNILGEKVATPFDGLASAGINQVVWDGRNSSGNSVASGIYFYRMKADAFEETRKMILMK